MRTSHDANPWLALSKPDPQASLRLFCFPYAGAGPSIFRNWGAHLPLTVEVCPIQLPGRDNRLSETLFTNILSPVNALAQGLSPYLDKPFAFFGHSLGAIIAFELARELRSAYGLEPAILFASARRAPHLVNRAPITYNLPEPEFKQELSRLSGTPGDVLKDPELMQLVMPILRADFQISETYVYSAEPALSCPITALGGLKDSDVTPRDLEAWREHTVASFGLKMLPGDHFFLRTYESALLEILSAELLEIVKLTANG